MNKLLILCGRRDSGKTKLGNYLTGYILRQNKVIKNFGITDSGDLVVNAYWQDENGNTIEGEGILDLKSRTNEHIGYFSNNVWPHIKCYQMVDIVKVFASMIFDVNEGKKTHVNWSNMFRFMPPFDVKEAKEKGKQEKSVPYSEFIDILNYEVLSVIKPTFMTDFLIRVLKEESSAFSVVLDCKSKTDAELIKKSFPEAKFVWFEPDHSKKEYDKKEKDLQTLKDFEFDYSVKVDGNYILGMQEKLIEWGFLEPFKAEQIVNSTTVSVYQEK